ncbi:MAG: DUF2817 domain-containing protein [Rhodospirillaceae bacterium]|jgi:hypothetical protein|nr:DUF2817 domain-containing protein [Rhodospirillaceae bacterium]
MDVVHYFPKGYADGRGKFLEACSSLLDHAPITLDSISHPLSGPDGEALATDIAVIGNPAAKRVLLLNSATHGTEGACGSGCMIGWLRSVGYAELPTNVRVVLVHAINPHGYAYVRRVTEDNVDLNRNFLDHDQPYPENPGYTGIHDDLIPAKWVGPEREAADQRLVAYADAQGAPALQAAISGGQYTHPDGLFFGGNAPTWSNLTFRDILRTIVAPAETVGFIDYHTGLGPYGTAELISGFPVDSPEFGRLVEWYGNGLASSAPGGASTSSSLSGCIDAAIPQELPDAEAVVVTAEYGTYSVKRVIDALRGDTWLANNRDGVDPELAAAIKAEVRQALYPDERDWKELVYLRSRQLIRRAIQALAEKV